MFKRIILCILTVLLTCMILAGCSLFGEQYVYGFIDKTGKLVNGVLLISKAIWLLSLNTIP